MLKLRKNKKGFTPVELIVVIAIMAILAGTVAGVTVSQLNKSKNDTAASDIKNLLNEFETFLASYDTSSITDVASAKDAITAFNNEKKASKGLSDNILTEKTAGATGFKAGENKYGYIVEVTAGTADKGTTIKLTIWCDKVGSTGATPTGTRTYEI